MNTPLSTTLMLVLTVWLAACGKSSESTEGGPPASATQSGRHSGRSLAPTGINSSTVPITLAERFSNAGETAAADIAAVSGACASVADVVNLSELRMRQLQDEKKEERRRVEEWEQEHQRLRQLYEQYSNAWESIPSESDRLMVAVFFLKHDENLARRITRELINASDPVVAGRATQVLACTYEREGQLDVAMRIYHEGEKRLLGDRDIEQAMTTLGHDERFALASLYHTKGVTFFAQKDYNGLAEAFRKCATLYRGDPKREACSYLDLASAYGKLKNREKVIDSLAKAEKCLSTLADDESRATTMVIREQIRMQQRNMNNGKWPDLEWYH